MIQYFADAFGSELTQRALVGGLLAAFTLALVGCWVVVRGMAFAGEALSHGVLPGIALAVLWGFNVSVGALVSAAVMMLGVALARRTGRVGDDTSLALLFVGMLALGVVIISRGAAYYGDLTALLFGDILSLEDSDLRFQAFVAVGTLAVILLLYRRLLALSFDPRKAAVLRQQPNFTQAALSALLALAIVASFQAIGTLLVMGLMIAPAATALLVVRRMVLVLPAAVLAGWLSVVLGLAVSYHGETAAAATVAGVAVGMFFVVAAARGMVDVLLRGARAH